MAVEEPDIRLRRHDIGNDIAARRATPCAELIEERREGDAGAAASAGRGPAQPHAPALPATIRLPLLGEVKIASVSLPVRTVALTAAAALHVVYPAVLVQADVRGGQRQVYLLLHVAVSMADDMAPFAGAMATLRLTGAGAGQAHAARLMGGVVMIAIAVLLWRPDALGLRPTVP